MGVRYTSLRYHDSETLRRRLTAPKGREEDRVRQKVLGESRSKFCQGLRELAVRLKSGRAGSLANHSYGTVCDSIKLDRFSVRLRLNLAAGENQSLRASYAKFLFCFWQNRHYGGLQLS